MLFENLSMLPARDVRLHLQTKKFENSLFNGETSVIGGSPVIVFQNRINSFESLYIILSVSTSRSHCTHPHRDDKITFSRAVHKYYSYHCHHLVILCLVGVCP